MLVPGILLVLGVPGAWIALRLLARRRRRDGGLFSPGLLRLSGAMLIVAPWIWLVGDPSDPWRWSHVVTLTSGGIACWILAARRDRRDARNEAISVPTNQPLT